MANWFSIAIIVVLASLLIRFQISNVNQILEDDVNISYRNYKNCKRIEAEGLIGPEDFVRVDDNLYITGADDRLSLWEISNPNLTAPGSLFAVSISKNKVKKLPLQNFPSELAFHPHGLYLFPGKGHQLLYVVNHAYHLGNDRIEVFKVTGSTLDDLSVNYHQSITSEIFLKLTGTLNDLIVVESGKLFVTQYRPFPDAVTGRGFHSSSFIGVVNDFLIKFYTFFGIKAGHTWFCSFDPNQPGETKGTCNQATTEPLLMPNGILIDREGIVYVACPISKTVTVYERENNHLIYSAFFRTPRGIDNLIQDHKTNTIYGGTMVPKEFLELNPHKKKESFVSGGLVEFESEKSEKRNNYIVTQPIFVPGYVYSGISVAVKEGEKYLFGSWYDDGVLICKLEQ